MKNIEYRILEHKHLNYSDFTPQWREKKSWFIRLFDSYKGWFSFHHGMEVVTVFDNYQDAITRIETDKKSRKEALDWMKDSPWDYETIYHPL